MRLISVLLIATHLFVLRIDAYAQNDETKKTARLSGVVVAADTGLPIEGARVRVGTSASMAITDAGGRFTIERVNPGSYVVTASATGYVSLGVGQRSPRDGLSFVELAAGSSQRIELRLPPLGRITGRIENQSGEPVKDVTVYALARTPEYVESLPPVRTTTGEDGTFVLPGVQPGRYYVAAETGGRPRETPALDAPTVVIPGVASSSLTYFPGTTFPDQATAVAVDAGVDADAGFTLAPPTRFAKISGVVLDANGLPATQFMVLPLGRPPQPPLPASMGIAVRDGRFELTGMPPGEYRLEIVGRQLLMAPVGGIGGEPGGPPPGEFARLRVRVAEEDIELAVRLNAGYSVSGRLVDSKGDAFAVADLVVEARQPEGLLVTPLPLPRAKTRADGTFTIEHVAGPHVLRVVGLPQVLMQRMPDRRELAVATRILADGVDVIDTPLDVSRNIDVEILIEQPTWLEGQVQNRKGAAIPEVKVAIFAEDPTRWEAGTRYVVVRQVSGVGEFQVFGLPPGRYYAGVVPPTIDGEPDGDTLRLLIPGATRLELTGPERKKITIKVD